MRQVAIALILAGTGAIILGAPEVGLFLGVAAILLGLLGVEDDPHRDAKRRNQARRIR